MCQRDYTLRATSGIPRVGNGREVEPEVGVVVELLVAELDEQPHALLLDRLGQHGLERRVERLEHVLHGMGDRLTGLGRVLINGAITGTP
jgi:hypothetical protein